jgi:hypothetical protein
MTNMHKYSEIVDGITFTGTYEQEDDDEGYCVPIFSLCSITIDNGIDLMLVIDPRVVQEIEEALLEDWKWNS